MTTPSMDIRTIALTQLALSRTGTQEERRRHFDKAQLAELAASIKAKGLLQPIVARPLTVESTMGLNGFRVAGKDYMSPDAAEEAARDRFEIIAGERRFLAAKAAGLKEIAVNVRPLTDEQVLEVQLIENLQRADVHPMAEAEGYEGLHHLGRSVEEIADKVGKSKAYVYARMKLLDLVKEGRAAFYAGKLNPSTALYLARVPKGLQLQALKRITEDRYNGPMSAREVQQYLHREFMLRLADAPFDKKDVTLVASAPACGVCPKRSGNNPDLFGDVSGADVCTDPICYRSKVAAHLAREIETAQASGARLILAAEAKRLAPHGVDTNVKGHVLLEDKDYDDPKSRTYGQILGKGYQPVLIVDEARGRLVAAAPQSDLPADRPRRSKSGHDDYRAQQRAATQKNLAERAFRGALFHQIRAAAAKAATLSRADLEAVAQELIDRLSHDSRRQFWKVMGWEGKKSKYHTGADFVLPTTLAKHSDAELAQLIRDLVLAPELMVYTYGSGEGKRLQAQAAHFKVDAKKLRAELAAAAKAKAAKKKPPASGKKKAAATTPRKSR